MIKQPKIMYIDDEYDLLHLASSFFADEEIPIETCANFNVALEKIRLGSYDLIISDARMPTGNGTELLKIIRDEKVFTGKFILVTGNLDYKNVQEQCLFDLVLFKPLRFQELVDHAKGMLKLKL